MIRIGHTLVAISVAFSQTIWATNRSSQELSAFDFSVDALAHDVGYQSAATLSQALEGAKEAFSHLTPAEARAQFEILATERAETLAEQIRTEVSEKLRHFSQNHQEAKLEGLLNHFFSHQLDRLPELTQETILDELHSPRMRRAGTSEKLQVIVEEITFDGVRDALIQEMENAGGPIEFLDNLVRNSYSYQVSNLQAGIGITIMSVSLVFLIAGMFLFMGTASIPLAIIGVSVGLVGFLIGLAVWKSDVLFGTGDDSTSSDTFTIHEGSHDDKDCRCTDDHADENAHETEPKATPGVRMRVSQLKRGPAA